MVLVLAVLMGGAGAAWSLSTLFRAIKNSNIAFKEFDLLDPATFDINKAHGSPRPAVDPEGDLIPIVDIPGAEWALWSLSQKRAVLRATGPPIFPETPPVLFNATSNEYVVASMTLRPGILKFLVPGLTIRVLAAESLKVKRKIATLDLFWMCDLSPSGRYLCGLALDPYPIRPQYDMIMRPMIIDLKTGKVRRESIHLMNAFFISEKELAGVRRDGIVRYDLQKHRSTGSYWKGALAPYSPQLFPPSGFYKTFKIDASCRSRDGNVLAAFGVEELGSAGQYHQDLGYLTFNVQSSDQATSHSLSSKFSNEFNITKPARHIYWGGMHACLNAERNLWILQKRVNDSKGVLVSLDWILLDLATGREHLLQTISATASSPPSSSICFVNPGVIGIWDGASVRFMPVDQALALPEPPP